MDDLARLRGQIRSIDARLLRLVKSRLDHARRVGGIKRRRGLPFRNYQVEAEVIRFARRECRRLRLPPDLGDEVMRLMIRASVATQEHASRRSPP